VTELFAGLLVSDRDTAERWWNAVLGTDPVMRPNDREVVWGVGAHGYVYVEVPETPDRVPGHGLVTLFVPDLDERVAAIAARGIEPTRREDYDNGARKVTYTDPDGNRLGLGGAG
jgi:catechol 2,3-dioxygenase-like lactoylglutathione lyase family enzyme